MFLSNPLTQSYLGAHEIGQQPKEPRAKLLNMISFHVSVKCNHVICLHSLDMLNKCDSANRTRLLVCAILCVGAHRLGIGL